LFAFSGTLHEEYFSAPMPMPWAERATQRFGCAPEVTSVGETFLQVVLHSQHHRGQICTRLRECGVEPPLVDYIAWLWTARPGPSWDLKAGNERSF
jgi:uncharacterized damage-inducible protein DinB